MLPIIKRIGEDTSLELSRDQLNQVRRLENQALKFQRQEFDALEEYRQAQTWLASRQQENLAQFRNQQIQQEEYSSVLDYLTNMQTNYSELFGGSYEGIMQGLLTNQSLLDGYGNGTLSPDQTNMVNTMLIELSTPYTEWNPKTGAITTHTPTLPRAVIEATRRREGNGLPAPVFPDRYGLNIPGMQEGGDPGWASFRERIAPDPAIAEPIPAGGAIVDETLSFERASGPPRAFQAPFNFLGDTLRDVTGVGGPPFPEIDKVGEQLRAVANQTQRFIRDSVAGRPFP